MPAARSGKGGDDSAYVRGQGLRGDAQRSQKENPKTWEKLRVIAI